MSIERCRACSGLGRVPTSSGTLCPDWRPCPWCDGRGQVFTERRDEKEPR